MKTFVDEAQEMGDEETLVLIDKTEETLYVSDLHGSLFEDSAAGGNLNSLESLLREY